WDGPDEGGPPPDAGRGVYLRQFDPLGFPLTGDVLVNDGPANTQQLPGVATSADGSAVAVTWQDDVRDGSQSGILATRFQQSVTQFSRADYSVSEGVVGGKATVTVVRPSPAGAASVMLATSDGTATAGQDYTPVNTTVNFADGETSKDVTIPII